MNCNEAMSSVGMHNTIESEKHNLPWVQHPHFHPFHLAVLANPEKIQCKRMLFVYFKRQIHLKDLEMAKRVKCFLHRHDDLCWDPPSLSNIRHTSTDM